MPNILSYLEAARDRSFSELPLSPVDSLILSEISYCDLEKSPFSAQAFSQTLSDWFSLPGTGKSLRGMITAESDRMLMTMLSAEGRHGNLKAAEHISILNDEVQFSAITYQITPGVCYIAFRGTDNSVIGWKEDAALYYLPHIPAQAEALRYAQAVMDRHPGQFYLGGHSKGGNLAVYAASHLSKEYQHRLITVFDHDGPGFPIDRYGEEGYLAIREKIHKTIPRSAVIGLMLENGVSCHVVESDQEALLQHDPFSWQVEGEQFIYLPDVDAFARHVDAALTRWTEGMVPEEREELVKIVFDAIAAAGARAFVDLTDNTSTHIHSMLEHWREASPHERKLVQDELLRLIRISAETAGSLIGEELKRGSRELRAKLKQLTDRERSEYDKL